MATESILNFDNIMLTSIDSEDFLDNEEKPSLTSSWSSDSDKDLNWKSSNSSSSQATSPQKSSILATSTPVKRKAINETKFLTCHETIEEVNARSLSNVDFTQAIDNTSKEMNNFSFCRLPKSKKSLSLHDLDNITEFPSNKLAKNTTSQELSHSLTSSKTRSKDSGIHRTASCVSLASNQTYNKKYDHIQSKVKQYIQNMKELGSKNRMQKNASKLNVSNNSESRVSSGRVELTEEKFKKLQNELLDKELLIATYHEKYINLQVKYADIKQKYDALRFNMAFRDGSSLDTLFCSVDEPSKLEKNEMMGANYQSKNEELFETPYGSNRYLKPVSSFYSTSAKLCPQYAPLHSIDKESGMRNLLHDEQHNSRSKDVDPFVKVKQWQESILSSKVEDNVNLSLFKNIGRNHYLSEESRTHLTSDYHSLPLELQCSNRESNVDPFKDQTDFKDISTELESYKLVKTASQEHLKSFSQVENKLLEKDEVQNPIQLIPFFLSKKNNISLSSNSSVKNNFPTFVNIEDTNSSYLDKNVSKIINSGKLTVNEEEKRKKFSKPRKKLKRNKHKGETFDTYFDHSKENVFKFSRVDDVTKPDYEWDKINPISAENTFKPAFDTNNMLKSVNNLDMTPFDSSITKNNLNIFRYSPKSFSQKNKENTTNPNSSQESVPRISSSSYLNSQTTNISSDKSSKSALCCCFEASDLYINQLNEGLDKLMVALADLGTSTVFKS